LTCAVKFAFYHRQRISSKKKRAELLFEMGLQQ
jgi:hypothetical protein